VNIGRHGDLIFNNGRHRLTFAKIAGVKKVPVTVTVRHIEWEKFKEKLEYYVQKRNRNVFAPLTHFDLQDIPVNINQEKYEMIKRSIDDGSTTLLDIQAFWGYFCHKFEELGFLCTAVENDPENLYFLEQFKKVESRKFNIVAESIVALSNRSHLQFDITLAFDLLGFLLRKELSLDVFRKFLSILDINAMYIELPVNTTVQNNQILEKLYCSKFLEFIIEHSCLEDYIVIGECEVGKTLYKIFR
jgi:hypothetical protein